MKKLLLLLLLFLIPNLVIAEVCVTDMFLTNTPSHGRSKEKLSKKDIDEVYNKITKRCKKDKILSFTLFDAERRYLPAEAFLLDIKTKFCNFNKTISNDMEGTNFHLACVYKDNRK